MPAASNLHPADLPHSVHTAPRDRLEALDTMPLRRGRCDWCGRRCGRRSYCGPACRTAYNNLLARQGKALAQILKLWRMHRGRAGTRGANKLTLISARVDRILAEDRARWAQEDG